MGWTRLKSMAPRIEVPCGAASRGHWGQNENPKILRFGRLQTPPAKISYTTPHYYTKEAMKSTYHKFSLPKEFDWAMLFQQLGKECGN